MVHTLPEGKPVLGVTLLSGQIFLLRGNGRDEVEVYDVITYSQLCRLTVPDLRSVTDMASCTHAVCIYISDHLGVCVHRLDVEATDPLVCR